MFPGWKGTAIGCISRPRTALFLGAQEQEHVKRSGKELHTEDDLPGFPSFLFASFLGASSVGHGRPRTTARSRLRGGESTVEEVAGRFRAERAGRAARPRLRSCAEPTVQILVFFSEAFQFGNHYPKVR